MGIEKKFKITQVFKNVLDSTSSTVRYIKNFLVLGFKQDFFANIVKH